jgi:hypothetical protein
MSSSSFISTEPAKAATSCDITGDPWFPSVSVAQFEKLYRLTDTVTPEIKQNLLSTALLSVCEELKTLKTKYPKATDFYDVPYTIIGDLSSTELDFINAVYSHAKSLQTEQYRDFDNTAKGHDRADDVDQSTDHYRRQSREAIRRLIGKSRLSVSLI